MDEFYDKIPAKFLNLRVHPISLLPQELFWDDANETQMLENLELSSKDKKSKKLPLPAAVVTKLSSLSKTYSLSNDFMLNLYRNCNSNLFELVEYLKNDHKPATDIVSKKSIASTPLKSAPEIWVKQIIRFKVYF